MDNNNLKIDSALLNKMIKDHKKSIQDLRKKLKKITISVITVYSLVQIIVFWVPLLSEVTFSIMIVISWILFLKAMIRIRTKLR